MRYMVLGLISALMFSMPVWADESSHRQAAAEFVAITEIVEITNIAMKQGLMAGLGNLPNKELYRDIVDDVAETHLSFKRVEDKYIDYHTTIFTEAELQDIVTFCKTPSGKKYIERSSDLNQYLTELIIPLMHQATPELVKRIQARTKELQQKNMQ